MKRAATPKPILASAGIFVLVLGVALVMAALNYRQTAEALQAEFEARADSLAAQISRELEITVATIGASASALRLNGETDGDMLRERLYAFLGHGNLLASSTAIRSVGLVMNGGFGQIGSEAAKFPILAAYPDTNSRVIGADLSFSPERMAAIDYAWMNGQAGVGDRIVLLTGVPGVFFAYPIYVTDAVATDLPERKAQTVGFIVAVLQTDSFMVNALSEIDQRGIDFEVHDLGPENAPRRAIGTDTVLASSRLENIAYTDLPSDELFSTVAPDALTRDINIAGHAWRILLSPKRSAAVAPGAYVAAAIGLVGLVLAALAAFATHQQLSQAALLKLRVEQRTQDLQAANSRISRQANEDMLTGLGNRRSLALAIQSMIDQSSDRVHHSIAAVHIDLDRFKQINDTMGHTGGDFVLRHVAALIQDAFPRDAFCARVGGDEFTAAMIVEKGKEAALEEAAHRLVRACSEPVHFEGRPCRFGASVGIALQAIAEVNPKTLLLDADLALNQAKEEGRGRIRLFTPEIQAKMIAHKTKADDILRAIEAGNEFIPYFQPQMSCDTGALYGVEALARWNHPKLGVLAPQEFLPIAEDLDVVAKIDRAILENAIHAMNRAYAAGYSVPHLSTNLSFSRLMEDDFVASISNLPECRSSVSFEILESVFLDDERGPAMWNIDSIRNAGMEVQIDDFGSGRASIVALTRVAPSRMKIDRELVAPIADFEERRRLVQSIVDIGKVLKIGITAEGVETPEQARLLSEMGCDVLQGYLFARPLSEAELLSFLGDRRSLGTAAAS